MMVKSRGCRTNFAQLWIVMPLIAAPLVSQEKDNVQTGSKIVCRSSSGPSHNLQATSSSSANRMEGLSVAVIVGCMAEAALQNESELRPYIVTREYQLFSQKREKARARVIADVIVRPPDFKNYKIQHSEGSVIGERIVRQVLEREAALAREHGASDISPANYDFRFLREEIVDDRRCYLLQLVPKREDKNLLRGTIWVDAGRYGIRRVEGQPAKSPSWWVRDVHIALVFGDADGMWLLKSSEYRAKLRMLGQSRMVARDLKYNYSQIAERGYSSSRISPRLAHKGE